MSDPKPETPKVPSFMRWPQCERCKDWNARGLSFYCPSCDADRFATPPKQ